MPAFRDQYGAWAVIAGASEGLGAAFAEACAARGLNLVLLARRAAPLEALAAKLKGVQTRVVSVDLSSPDLHDTVAAATADLEVGFLVCSAASSVMAPFLDVPLAVKLQQLEVNCRAPVVLAHLFGGPMRARGRGGMVFMSSLAGLISGPYAATYSASKAFDSVLAESLSGELSPHGVQVISCLAGPTDTPTYARTASQQSALSPMSPQVVVEQTLDALGSTPRFTPGFRNRWLMRLLALLPRKTLVAMVAAETKKTLPPG